MPETRETLTLRNKIAELERLSDFIAEFGDRNGLAQKDVFAFTLSLEELVTNIINYGYRGEGEHPIILTMLVEDGTVCALLEDQAPAFDPFAREEVDITLGVEDRPIGGLGIHLCKKMMDHVSYDHTGGFNRVHLHRMLRGPGTTVAVPDPIDTPLESNPQHHQT
ncbi:MAG: ATP-binding protein [Candidatus Methylacidiphilales bacterium]|nr:ATP-binding protein [Candidatus Methylacidiphilales bacterium]